MIDSERDMRHLPTLICVSNSSVCVILLVLIRHVHAATEGMRQTPTPVVITADHAPSPQPKATGYSIPPNTTEGERRIDFAVTFVQELCGHPPDSEIVHYLISWTKAEDRGSGALGANNPLNTTRPSSEVTMVRNGDGVKGYVTWEGGIDATVRTLHDGFRGYQTIMDGLCSDDPGKALDGLYQSPWGTNADTVKWIWQNE